MPRMHRHRLGGKQPPRRFIQLAAAALFNGYAAGFAKGTIYTGALKTVCVPVLNCYSCPGALGSCPIGALQAVVGGAKHQFSFYVLGTIMLFGVLLGRLACGFLCPFGLIQDLLHKIPVPKRRVPEKIDKPLRWAKYAIFIVMVVLLPMFATNALGTAPPFFCQYLCPAGTLEGGIPNLLRNADLRALAGWLFGWKLFVLVAIAALSTTVSRPFCRYLCPLGALYGLFNRFSLARLTIDQTRCTHCRACEKACPMQLSPPKNLQSPECIQCSQCQRACPTAAIHRTCAFKSQTEMQE